MSLKNSLSAAEASVKLCTSLRHLHDHIQEYPNSVSPQLRYHINQSVRCYDTLLCSGLIPIEIVETDDGYRVEIGRE